MKAYSFNWRAMILSKSLCFLKSLTTAEKRWERGVTMRITLRNEFYEKKIVVDMNVKY